MLLQLLMLLLGISKVCSGSVTLVFVPFLGVVLSKFFIDQVQSRFFVMFICPGCYPRFVSRLFVQVLCSGSLSNLFDREHLCVRSLT